MKSETYRVGDTVKKTSAGFARYPAWKCRDAIIVSVKMRTIKDVDLSPSDKTMYRNRYTYQEVYPIFEMIVQSAGQQFLTSQFFFNKD